MSGAIERQILELQQKLAVTKAKEKDDREFAQLQIGKWDGEHVYVAGLRMFRDGDGDQCGNVKVFLTHEHAKRHGYQAHAITKVAVGTNTEAPVYFLTPIRN